MAWVVVGVLLVVVAALVAYLYRLNQSGASQTQNPSVIVDMDDQPPQEIDFDSGIRANQKALSDSKNSGE